ncbi:hypothetical protein BMW24_016250 [Mycobacterium heckeshornense]|uniref:hypothetical protein n=1 Tax=Mycobacterium heckeshornense TaxID=110505 RepID=UPI000662242A|nr:hypothetical protein [Mycobacterium heckeshornense]KMV22339.1 hypothetical protein ACT16_12005 [Mycobacterium heckeshornense]MCV7035039.1 hypothetical protein [Mycobacterium heckeshornense]PIJ33311.1 hypothetical protein BMW24_016250 [Mycobacterium heckeshornense]
MRTNPHDLTEPDPAAVHLLDGEQHLRRAHDAVLSAAADLPAARATKGTAAGRPDRGLPRLVPAGELLRHG